MADEEKDARVAYNLEGGPRLLVKKNGVVKAVAPGLRLVDATDAEAETLKEKKPPAPPEDYGIPV